MRPARKATSIGLDAFRAGQQAATDAGIDAVGSRTHSTAAVRIASVAARAPAHRRTAISRLAVSARQAVEHSRTAGSERLLRALLAVDPPESATDGDEAWLTRVIDLDRETPNVNPRAASEAQALARVVAVILLVPQRRITEEQENVGSGD